MVDTASSSFSTVAPFVSKSASLTTLALPTASASAQTSVLPAVSVLTQEPATVVASPSSTSSSKASASTTTSALSSTKISSSTSTKTIVIAVVVSVVGTFIVLALVLFLFRKHRRGGIQTRATRISSTVSSDDVEANGTLHAVRKEKEKFAVDASHLKQAGMRNKSLPPPPLPASAPTTPLFGRFSRRYGRDDDSDGVGLAR
ncbi:uncharacterized protein V2V93DRAFT_371158 [Kockiozyma suomiensis]|uniref:uncharacterized protein n=1 Tax=Kockiozyma suomiensis TaxID=1337062 RepID=UPI003344386A